jgi:hypothetical protein
MHHDSAAPPHRRPEVTTNVFQVRHPDLVRRLGERAARTATELGTPISTVTVLVGDTAFFVGQHGLTGWPARVGGVPAEFAFWTTTVATGAPHFIEDARQDPLHRDNPLVVRLGLVSYCGVPLDAPGGAVLGAHCVLDTVPRRFGAPDVAVLQLAAAEVIDVLHEYPARDLRPLPGPVR